MRKVHVCLGCTNMRSPEIGTVLHWRLPDVHIFHTDPSLVCCVYKQTIVNLNNKRLEQTYNCMACDCQIEHQFMFYRGYSS